MAGTCCRIILLLACIITFSLNAGEPTEDVSLKDVVEKYVGDIRSSFDRIDNNRAVRKGQISKTNRYLVGVLKKHRTIIKLMRTNSKGRMINEVIRGRVPKRVNKNISKEKWYSFVSRKKKEYNKVVYDEESGRYFVFWAAPVMLKTSKGGKRFAGVVAAKIDLWDTFHWFSKKADEPFLIRLNKMVLYSNRWEMAENFKEKAFKVPGIKRISIRYLIPEVPVQAEPEKMRSTTDAATQKEAKVKSKAGSGGKPKADAKAKLDVKAEDQVPAMEKSGPSILPMIIVVIFVLLIIGAIVFISKQKRKRMMQVLDDMEKPDSKDQGA